MKLQLRTLDQGNKVETALVLTDENGVMLPGQVAVDIAQRVGEGTRITVEFAVDGRDIKIATAMEATKP